MNVSTKKIPTWLSPILGAGAVGGCPLCWIGSASLLTYLGLGALVPLWRWIVLVLLGFGLVGFIFDYRAHKNLYPLILLITGGIPLYLGRYVFGGVGFGGWQIWVPGGLLLIGAVIYNKKQFSKKVKQNHEHL